MTFVLSCIAVTFAVSFLPLHLFFTVTDLGLWGITAQNIKVLLILVGVELNRLLCPKYQTNIIVSSAL